MSTDTFAEPAASFEVVVTTYNSPAALDLTLWALAKQVLPRPLHVCVADDGSDDKTGALIRGWQAQAQHRGFAGLRHVWHEDQGFRKNRILNQAIATSSAKYLIFIDGDCLASPGFVQRHLELAQTGHFVSGGMIRLPLEATPYVTAQSINNAEVFSLEWLRQHQALDSVGDWLKAALLPTSVSRFLERISPVKRTWNGGNASGWRADLIAVNGFNETLRYGAEDVELGVRLNHFGVRGKHCRYSAALLHLEHDRSYADTTLNASNKAHIQDLRGTSVYWTKHGIVPSTHPAPYEHSHERTLK